MELYSFLNVSNLPSSYRKKTKQKLGPKAEQDHSRLCACLQGRKKGKVSLFVYFSIDYVV